MGSSKKTCLRERGCFVVFEKHTGNVVKAQKWVKNCSVFFFNSKKLGGTCVRRLNGYAHCAKIRYLCDNLEHDRWMFHCIVLAHAYAIKVFLEEYFVEQVIKSHFGINWENENPLKFLFFICSKHVTRSSDRKCQTILDHIRQIPTREDFHYVYEIRCPSFSFCSIRLGWPHMSNYFCFLFFFSYENQKVPLWLFLLLCILTYDNYELIKKIYSY